MSLFEIDRQIAMYKRYIIACNIAIGNLNQAINRIDDCKPNLQSAKDATYNGYIGGASSLAVNEVNECNINATVQRDSATARITTLQNDIVEFEQKIRQLEAARAAEVARLARAARSHKRSVMN